MIKFNLRAFVNNTKEVMLCPSPYPSPYHEGHDVCPISDDVHVYHFLRVMSTRFLHL